MSFWNSYFILREDLDLDPSQESVLIHAGYFLFFKIQPEVVLILFLKIRLFLRFFYLSVRWLVLFYKRLEYKLFTEDRPYMFLKSFESSLFYLLGSYFTRFLYLSVKWFHFSVYRSCTFLQEHSRHLTFNLDVTLSLQETSLADVIFLSQLCLTTTPTRLRTSKCITTTLPSYRVTESF